MLLKLLSSGHLLLFLLGSKKIDTGHFSDHRVLSLSGVDGDDARNEQTWQDDLFYWYDDGCPGLVTHPHRQL